MFVTIGILAVIVVVIVTVANGRSNRTRSLPSSPGAPEGGAAAVSGDEGVIAQWLGRWVAADVLSVEQADAILAYERSVAPAPVPAEAGRRRVPPVAEALGYLGGILAVVGIVLLVARYWPDMADALRLGVGLVGMVVFVAAGFAIASFVPAIAILNVVLLDAHIPQADRVPQGGDPEIRDGRSTGTQEQGRDVPHDLVDDAGGEEGGRKARSALEQDVADLSLGQAREHIAWIARAQDQGRC